MGATVFGQSVGKRISSTEQLRETAKMPSRYVDAKVIDHIDPLAQRFIAASPLAILGTRREDGGVDQTPRGDPPGFVKVLDPIHWHYRTVRVTTVWMRSKTSCATTPSASCS